MVKSPKPTKEQLEIGMLIAKRICEKYAKDMIDPDKKETERRIDSYLAEFFAKADKKEKAIKKARESTDPRA